MDGDCTRVACLSSATEEVTQGWYPKQMRRQEVTPPVARTRRARGEVMSDDDKGDDDDEANRVDAGGAAA